ncbi:MAG: hypothetical protein A3F83_07170 [Candidatus Glassbacteria bacterium RIFCSPLOWO2_12_FULL_58_11]|uniref:histidine kinase n=1 Tax=Candidatus Glassbacteria bacterium RIFCSPLOWO2_12_FULL_58_11 TaxID=1817867 RepID=A0A1F5YKP0_9BACT|nr:MAG: hypothetical protein A3F83_07170 [Candidatus Glassbacteria bacterium RIFCSPLOWO2_12_FULL_58_11]
MQIRKLIWQFYPAYVIITVIAFIFLAWYTSSSLREFYLKETAQKLEIQAKYLERQFRPHLDPPEPEVVNTICRGYGEMIETRITVILPSGAVIGDSDEEPQQMDNHRDRPEVLEALQGRKAVAVRYSHTLGKNMMYLGLPVLRQGKVLVVLRTSTPLIAVDRALEGIYRKIALVGVATLLLMFAATLIAFRRLSRPLEELREGAELFARGNLDYKLRVPWTLEIAALADSMNRMAAMLNERIRIIEQQRNELEALLGGMAEGVMAIDTEERIVRMNQAAAGLFRVVRKDSEGRVIQEVVRNTEFQKFVQTALAAKEQVESEIELFSEEQRVVHLYSSPLSAIEGQRSAVLIVLNDITRLRRLENVRREFVSNVSHELKTPITSIKGFVETLMDGAMDQPAELKRFLSIIAKQVERLIMIIEDILNLSRIEQQAENLEIPLEHSSVNIVIAKAVQSCMGNAELKNIALNLETGPEARTAINAPLLEMALVNLIDNAIKYSEPWAEVRVDTSKGADELVINVRDNGCGIEKKHLSRIFERFYRVDKARSRKLGGTGLGLAIVKHIVQVHQGQVTVESTPGKGSVFSIHLPLSA